MAIEIEGWEKVEEVELPQTQEEDGNPGRDTSDHECTVCGVPVYRTSGRGPWPKYCPEHKTGNSPSSKASSGGGSKHKGGATESEWRTFGATALIALTYLFGRFLAGGKGVFLRNPGPMTDEQFEGTTEYLSMSADEAKPIAQILALRLTPTTFNKKYGKHIVAILEYEEAGAALYTYGQRVGPAITSRVNQPKTPKQPRKREPEQSFIQRSNGNVPTQPLSNIEAARAFRPDAAGSN